MIRKALNKLLIADPDQSTCDFNDYIKKVESGVWHDKFVFGIAEAERDFYTVNPVEQPGTLYFGGMGSGKSSGLKFSMITRMITNSENDLYILLDPQKGMTDYKTMFPYRDNVAVAVNDPAKIIPLVDMLYAECMARKAEFSRVGAAHIFAYEKIMRQTNPNFKLARIIVCMEEFHAVIGSDWLKFSYKCDQEGTAAFMLKQLFRISRSYGFFFALASQRCTPDDTPSTIKVGLTTILGFRVNNPGDAAAANLPQAADIPSNLRGRCAYEHGYMQFPWIGDETSEKLIAKYYKPLKAKLLKYQVEDYHKAFAGEGNEGMVKIKPLKDILQNISQFNPLDVFIRFLESFDFKVEKQTNPALNVNLIAERDGEKYAVLALTNRNQQTEKNISAFKQGAKILECENVIAISHENISSATTSGLKEFTNKLLADGEDLMRIADVLDNRAQLEEDGTFEELYSKLVFAKVEKEEIQSEEEDDDDDDFPSFEELKNKIRRGE